MITIKKMNTLGVNPQCPNLEKKKKNYTAIDIS